MNVLPVGIALCLVSVHAFAAGNSSLYTGLTDLNQNPAFRPKLPAAPASSFKLAKVHFVVDTADKIGFDDIEQSFDHNNAQRCKDLGFAQTAACAANQFKARLCPYDDAYYDRCCDNDYKYTKGECSYPNTISSTSCGGKYKCYCDTDPLSLYFRQLSRSQGAFRQMRRCFRRALCRMQMPLLLQTL